MILTELQIREASEQLQDNLITLLDGQPQALVDRVCQTVVDKFFPMKAKAKRGHLELLNAQDTLLYAQSALKDYGADETTKDGKYLAKMKKKLDKVLAPYPNL